MMQQVLIEGWLLLRSRLWVSLALSLALAVPLSLAGVVLLVGQWLRPFTTMADERFATPVLLHPRLSETERTEWIAHQRELHPEWEITLVPPAELAQRLGSWFPYLDDFLRDEGTTLLPSLLEITTAQPSSLDNLVDGSVVTAIGPRNSVHRLLGMVAERLGVFFGVLCGVLLGAAAALAAVWVHLEVYRHADELTVLRLIGAEEHAIRGPFLVAVTVPGVCAALLSAVGTLIVVHALGGAAEAMGLAPLVARGWVLALQAGLGLLLPGGAGAVTLARHAYLES